MTKRRTRQCNDQKKKDKTMQWPKEEGQDSIVLSFFFWSLHCIVLLLLVILLSCPLLVIALSCPSFGTRRTRECNDQMKDKTIE
jgi:hypothetical protein